MINEELNHKKRQRILMAVMIALGITLAIFFIVSCQSTLTPDTTPTDGSTVTEETTQPTEPSKYEGYTIAFGENSLQTALTGVKYEDLTDKDKAAIESVMSGLGGNATITEESITLALSGQSAIIYYDGTTTLIDASGNAGGTRWLDTELSQLIKQPENVELVMCLSTADSFAAKYKCSDAAAYTAYCAALKEMSWTEQSMSDVMFVAVDASENTLNVSFSEGVLTVMIQKPQVVAPETTPDTTEGE